MAIVAYTPFMEFCKTKINQQLPTIGGRAKFKLTSVEDDCLRWIVIAKNSEHYSKQKWIQKYLDYFNKTSSFNTSEYNQNINCTESSYILRLIKLYTLSLSLPSFKIS